MPMKPAAPVTRIFIEVLRATSAGESSRRGLSVRLNRPTCASNATLRRGTLREPGPLRAKTGHPACATGVVKRRWPDGKALGLGRLVAGRPPAAPDAAAAADAPAAAAPANLPSVLDLRRTARSAFTSLATSSRLRSFSRNCSIAGRGLLQGHGLRARAPPGPPPGPRWASRFSSAWPSFMPEKVPRLASGNCSAARTAWLAVKRMSFGLQVLDELVDVLRASASSPAARRSARAWPRWRSPADCRCGAP